MARGSVFRKDNGWAFRIDAGVDASTGRRRQVLRQGFTTKRAAEAALHDTVQAATKGTVVAKSSMRLGDYLDQWLDGQRSRLRPSSVHGYATSAKRLKAGLGHVPVQALTPMQIEGFYTDLLRQGGRTGTGISAKTIRNTHEVLRKALADAERLGVVARNAAAAAKAPSVARPEFTTWSSDDLKTFFAFVAEHRLYPLFVTLATTGLRRGEVLGLRWKDIDFDARQLAVVQTLVSVAGKSEFGTPKTPRSRRTVFLDDQTIAVLREHRRRQRQERVRAGAVWDDDNDLVFRDEIGRPLRPEGVSREFRLLVADGGVPEIRLHDLRHTHATLALKAGVHPKVVSDRLGHSTIAITLDLYSHVTPGIAREAADAVAARIFG